MLAPGFFTMASNVVTSSFKDIHPEMARLMFMIIIVMMILIINIIMMIILILMSMMIMMIVTSMMIMMILMILLILMIMIFMMIMTMLMIILILVIMMFMTILMIILKVEEGVHGDVSQGHSGRDSLTNLCWSHFSGKAHHDIIILSMTDMINMIIILNLGGG